MVLTVNICGDLCQLFLLIRHRHALKDAVVTAAEPGGLILRQVSVLRNFLDADFHIPGDTADNIRDLSLIHI